MHSTFSQHLQLTPNNREYRPLLCTGQPPATFTGLSALIEQSHSTLTCEETLKMMLARKYNAEINCYFFCFKMSNYFNTTILHQIPTNKFYLFCLRTHYWRVKKVVFVIITSRSCLTIFFTVHWRASKLKYANVFILLKLLKQGRTFTNKVLWWITQLVLVAFFVSYFILNYVDGGTVINVFFLCGFVIMHGNVFACNSKVWVFAH